METEHGSVGVGVRIGILLDDCLCGWTRWCLWGCSRCCCSLLLVSGDGARTGALSFGSLSVDRFGSAIRDCASVLGALLEFCLDELRNLGSCPPDEAAGSLVELLLLLDCLSMPSAFCKLMVGEVSGDQCSLCLVVLINCSSNNRQLREHCRYAGRNVNKNVYSTQAQIPSGKQPELPHPEVPLEPALAEFLPPNRYTAHEHTAALWSDNCVCS